jgi:uncharacterized protein (TIGR03435 family)
LTRSLAALLLAVTLSAQTFDVASVKLSGPESHRGSEGGPGTSVPGRFRYTSATLLDLLALAHGVEYFQLSSKTPLDRDRYDVIVNVPAGATKEQFRVMLRNLLAERFRLKSHTESREFPAYELVVAKSGHKLNQQRAVEGFPDLAPDKPGMATSFAMKNGQSLARTRGQQMPIEALITDLHRAAGSPVVDHTGLTDKYDFTLEYARQMGGSSDTIPEVAIAPSIFTAVQQQLGLQLVSKRLPFDVIAVDSFNRVPAEN